jgi:hypothetical protein
MLTIVPEWARLLFWPAHLQGEYGPPAVSLTGAPLGSYLLGVALLVGALVLLAWGWYREKTMAMGLLWMAAALLPVSNLLAPTGILLAERTLLLPSVGAVLVAAIIAVRLASLLRAMPVGLRVAAAAGIALIVAAGEQSAERATVWKTQSVFFAHLVDDAPRTYRAHYVASRFYYGEKRYPEALEEARAVPAGRARARAARAGPAHHGALPGGGAGAGGRGAAVTPGNHGTEPAHRMHARGGRYGGRAIGRGGRRPGRSAGVRCYPPTPRPSIAEPVTMSDPPKGTGITEVTRS